MTRAAGIFLLLAVTFDIFDGNQYLIHGHAEEIPERVEVIYSRKALEAEQKRAAQILCVKARVVERGFARDARCTKPQNI